MADAFGFLFSAPAEDFHFGFVPLLPNLVLV
jgi:hypothetical protein